MRSVNAPRSWPKSSLRPDLELRRSSQQQTASRTSAVNKVRNKFLAGTAFTINQYICIRRGNLGNLVADSCYPCAAADHSLTIGAWRSFFVRRRNIPRTPSACTCSLSLNSSMGEEQSITSEIQHDDSIVDARQSCRAMMGNRISTLRNVAILSSMPGQRAGSTMNRMTPPSRRWIAS